MIYFVPLRRPSKNTKKLAKYKSLIRIRIKINSSSLRFLPVLAETTKFAPVCVFFNLVLRRTYNHPN
jgi:hypothetical protein